MSVRGSLEVIVRPGSAGQFIEMRRRFRGGTVTSVNSREMWIRGNTFLAAMIAVVSVFTLWLFTYIDALLPGILLVLFFVVLYLPYLWLFLWPFFPSKDGRASESNDR